MPEPERRSIALFTSTYLPYSQTFIHDEIRFHRRYAVEVFTTARQHADRFPHQPVHTGGRLYKWTNVSFKFRRLLRRATDMRFHPPLELIRFEIAKAVGFDL